MVGGASGNDSANLCDSTVGPHPPPPPVHLLLTKISEYLKSLPWYRREAEPPFLCVKRISECLGFAVLMVLIFRTYVPYVKGEHKD